MPKIREPKTVEKSPRKKYEDMTEGEKADFNRRKEEREQKIREYLEKTEKKVSSATEPTDREYGAMYRKLYTNVKEGLKAVQYRKMLKEVSNKDAYNAAVAVLEDNTPSTSL